MRLTEFPRCVQVVTADEGRAVAQAHNILFFEASAESGVGVSEVRIIAPSQTLRPIAWP